MPIPQEICVFFPCHTLEDFPTHLRDESADGLLVAWTVPWHPQIVAATGNIPSWHRADTPPVELKHRLLLVPSAAESRVPSDLNGRMADAIDCHRISVTDRATTSQEIFSYLEINEAQSDDAADRADSGGTTSASIHSPNTFPVTPADFYALGYLALQVQVMTRRLRYSSNLDVVTFTEHVVAAAKAFVQGEDSIATESLQAAFDLLAEERDHYFSSDPHLIDLVLVAESTLGPDLMETLAGDHPLNLLLSANVAQRIAEDHPAIADRIRQRVAAQTLSIVGGAPDDQSRLDLLGSAAVAHWLEKALDQTEASLGARPRVFGRLGGGIPGDLPPWLVAQGFVGAVTNNFLTGVGWQDEAKLLWQAGGVEIEAMTAKPLEVVQSQTFLGLGSKLGEAADSGQVSAALLVRWPGCDSPFMKDLRLAAKRSLALGRFWTLDQFFTLGERPYHSCSLPSVTGDGTGLETEVETGVQDPLSKNADLFVRNLTSEAIACCAAMTGLMPLGQTTTETSSEAPTLDGAAASLCRALGFQPTGKSAPGSAIALINPHCGAARGYGELSGPPPADTTPGLFGSSKLRSGTRITIDIPGNGFATAQCNQSASEKSTTKTGFFGLFKKTKPLAHAGALSNEFLDVAIHPDTGAIAAVHAGQQRGNRFSWQLALYDASGPGDGYTSMRCTSLKVLEADASRGTIEARGELRFENESVAKFVNRYTVQQGSRWLEIESDLESLDRPFTGSPWKNYIAGRATWATDALSIRPMVRDKRHRTSGRRIEAPLGVLVDEGDRKLQVCAYGMPAHRRIGSKELDTLLAVRGESATKFRLAYGFDVPDPVRAARQRIVPPVAVSLESIADVSRSWLLDVDARTAIISHAKAIDANTLELVVVETAGKSTRARISLFRDVKSACHVQGGEALEIQDAAAVLRLSGHEVIAVRLVLQS